MSILAESYPSLATLSVRWLGARGRLYWQGTESLIPKLIHEWKLEDDQSGLSPYNQNLLVLNNREVIVYNTSEAGLLNLESGILTPLKGFRPATGERSTRLSVL